MTAEVFLKHLEGIRIHMGELAVDKTRGRKDDKGKLVRGGKERKLGVCS